MPPERPTVSLTCFPDEDLMAWRGEIVPRKVYARVELPAGAAQGCEALRLFVRVRPASKLGVKEEPFTDATKGDIHDPQLDDPAENYRMDLVRGYSPLEGGRPVPGPGWFEVFDLQREGVREDVEVEAHLFWNTGKWCGDRRVTVRRCSHPARLISRFPIGEARGLIAVGDLDRDGQMDFVVTAGAARQAAYRPDGAVLWDHHDPGATRINAHNTLVPICDIDGDGANEVVAVRREGDAYFICVLDGRTGAVKRRAPLPEPVRAYDDPPIINIQIANLRGLERPSDIVFSHHYSDIMAFDEKLNVLWQMDTWADEGRSVGCKPPRDGAEARFPYGFGHTPAIADLDGDGHDEVIAGACLIDHDGRFVWNRKDLPRINYDHNDSVAIADLERDGRLSVLLSTGLWCLDPQGNVRWGFAHTVCHGQHVWVEPIIPDSPRLQIVLVDWRCYVGLQPPHVVYLIDGDGAVLWHRISGWAIPLYWSACGHQDIWLKPEGMTGAGEIVNHKGEFLAYVPTGAMEAVRPFIRRPEQSGKATDTVVTTVTREGKPYMEFYECSVPPERLSPGGIPRQYHADDRRYSLY